jgi:hypothetical protein
MTNIGRYLTQEDLAMCKLVIKEKLRKYDTNIIVSFVTIITHEQGAASYIAAAFDPELESRIAETKNCGG